MSLIADRRHALGAHVLRAFGGLDVAGGYRFTPPARDLSDATNPRDPHHDGVRHTIDVGGVPVARGAADGASYCCGITFACWWEALALAGNPRPTDADDMLDLVATWFCPTMGHSGVVEALVSRGWGDQVAVEGAQPGDLVQYWRRTNLARPSGHSAIWIGLDRGVLRYASSQPATNGVGVHREEVGPGWQIDVVRPWFLREDGGSTGS